MHPRIAICAPVLMEYRAYEDRKYGSGEPRFLSPFDHLDEGDGVAIVQHITGFSAAMINGDDM